MTAQATSHAHLMEYELAPTYPFEGRRGDATERLHDELAAMEQG